MFHNLRRLPALLPIVALIATILLLPLLTINIRLLALNPLPLVLVLLFGPLVITLWPQHELVSSQCVRFVGTPSHSAILLSLEVVGLCEAVEAHFVVVLD